MTHLEGLAGFVLLLAAVVLLTTLGMGALFLVCLVVAAIMSEGWWRWKQWRLNRR